MKKYLCVITVCGMLVYGSVLAGQPGWQTVAMPDSWQQLLDGCQVQADDLVYCRQLHSSYRAEANRVQVPLAWLDNTVSLELGIQWQPRPYLPQGTDFSGGGRYSYFGLSAASGSEIRLGLDSSGYIPRQQQPALLLQVSNPW